MKHLELTILDEIDESVEAASVFAVDGLVGNLGVADEFETVDDSFGAFLELLLILDRLIDTTVNGIAETDYDQEKNDLDCSFHFMFYSFVLLSELFGALWRRQIYKKSHV